MNHIKEDDLKLGDGVKVDDVARLIEAGRGTINVNGIMIPIRYRRGRNEKLVILFHGATNRSLKPYPRFQAFVSEIGDAHQISIADPTLKLHDDLAAAWYAGGKGLPVQKYLTKAIQKIAERIGVNRKVYIGGSSGGFAALFYAWRDPGSVCIAANPQIDIMSYTAKAVDSYIRLAWPGVEVKRVIKEGVVLNVGNLYKKRFENTVVYLQSTGDRRHFAADLPEFVRTGCANPDHFILNVGYWGVPGHSNSVPIPVYYPWIRAVLAAPSTSKQDILDTYHTLQSKQFTAPVGQAARSGKAEPQFSVSDIAMAALLNTYQMRDMKGGFV